MSLRDELLTLEDQQAQLKSSLEQPEGPPLLHRSVADMYREKVTGLCQSLQGDE